ncbi:MAG: ribosome maturation factor RimM [bacterium]|nr:ribosome maturation factor RimM [Candidatus Sumerlaeota bacterium]
MNGDLLDIDLITIGHITRAQGRNGEVRMAPNFNPPQLFEQIKSPHLWLAVGKNPPAQYPFRSFHYHQQFIIIAFDGINDMDQARTIAGAEVLTPADALWELPEGQYFTRELAGASVTDAQSGDLIGIVGDVIPGSAHDYLRVERAGRSFLVPFAKGIVRDVNLAARRIEVELPPGIDEL